MASMLVQLYQVTRAACDQLVLEFRSDEVWHSQHVYSPLHACLFCVHWRVHQATSPVLPGKSMLLVVEGTAAVLVQLDNAEYARGPTAPCDSPRDPRSASHVADRADLRGCLRDIWTPRVVFIHTYVHV